MASTHDDGAPGAALEHEIIKSRRLPQFDLPRLSSLLTLPRRKFSYLMGILDIVPV
jgi:hypothetical protein